MDGSDFQKNKPQRYKIGIKNEKNEVKTFYFGDYICTWTVISKKKKKQLVGGTELEDSQKQRFHISRSFSSDTCQGNRQNKECRAETAYLFISYL